MESGNKIYEGREFTMKKSFTLITGLILSLYLVACNQQPNIEPKPPDYVDVGGKGIVEGTVQPNLSLLEVMGADGSFIFHYQLKNQTEKIVDFTFSNGMQYDYIIREEESGEQVFQYSHDRAFTEAIVEKELLQGDNLTYRLEVPTQDLEKGNYILEVWLTSESKETYSQKISFEVR